MAVPAGIPRDPSDLENPTPAPTVAPALQGADPRKRLLPACISYQLVSFRLRLRPPAGELLGIGLCLAALRDRELRHHLRLLRITLILTVLVALLSLGYKWASTHWI